MLGIPSSESPNFQGLRTSGSMLNFRGVAPVRKAFLKKNKFIFQARWFKLRCLYLWVCNDLGGGLKYFLFSSLPGGMIQFNIFQMSWNHQLVMFFFRNLHHSLPIPSEKNRNGSVYNHPFLRMNPWTLSGIRVVFFRPRKTTPANSSGPNLDLKKTLKA